MEANLKNNLKKIITTSIVIIFAILLIIEPLSKAADQDTCRHSFLKYTNSEGNLTDEEAKGVYKCNDCGALMKTDATGGELAKILQNINNAGVHANVGGKTTEEIEKNENLKNSVKIYKDEGSLKSANNQKPTDNQESPKSNEPDDVSSTLFSGIIGFFLTITKLKILLIGAVIQGVGRLIFGETFGPEMVLFNKLDILDIDFFDLQNTTGAIGTMKLGISTFYYNFRNLATGALLATLAYIGIRMALSTISEDKARYKKLLRYWVESFVLLWMLHFIMILIIEINTQIVGLLETDASIPYKELIVNSLKNVNVMGVAQAVSYLAILAITAVIFAMYLKRLLVVGFLIIIAPLITITYSIDKVKDSQSQALNNWLKHFMYNVLIQIFHCILYLVFIKGVVELQNSAQGEGSAIVVPILSVAMLFFILQAEKLIKEIFGFNAADSSLMNALVAGKMLSTGEKLARKAGTGMKKTAKGMLKAGDAMTGHKVSQKWNNSEKIKPAIDKLGSKVNKARGIINDMGGNLGTDMARATVGTALSGSAAGGISYAESMRKYSDEQSAKKEAKNVAESAINSLKNDPSYSSLRKKISGDNMNEITKKILSVLNEENSIEGHQSRLIMTKLVNAGKSEQEAINDMAKSVLKTKDI